MTELVRLPALPAVAAFAARVQVSTIRKWAARGLISPADENGCYDLVEIVAWIERRSTVKVRSQGNV